jgi:hypothetical protein
MAEDRNRVAPGGQTVDLTERVTRYAQLIEKVVLEVGEHPDFEMKRECSIAATRAKIEFVKDVQSIATSRIETEKFLIIGADHQTRQFQSVSNRGDFDEAKLHDILAAYLDPVPFFEVFEREAPDGSIYVFLVIPRQPSRLIFAKATVGTQLRQGDLWTKGTGTAKRLATHADFTEIMEELIEARVDERVRVRVDHAVELALVRQNVANDIGLRLLPPSFDDSNFKPLMESLCASGEERRFQALMERLRDDLIESWGRFGDYDKEARARGGDFRETAHDVLQQLNDHYDGVFRPALRWLTHAGVLTVKNAGPKSFLNSVSDLLRETFEISHQLLRLHSLNIYGFNTRREGEHFSHVSPAIAAATACHTIGAYLAKRKRFEYFTCLTRQDVQSASWQGEEMKKHVLAFWPIELGVGFGEPKLLSTWGGRIKYCARQIQIDPVIAPLFGSESDSIGAMCQYEFCLELNSFLAMPAHSGQIGAYIEKTHPSINFIFNPVFYAFTLDYIREIVAALFWEIKSGKPSMLKQVVWEPSAATSLASQTGLKLFADFLDGIARDQAQWFISSGRAFPPMFNWPSTLRDELKTLRASDKK